MTPALAPSGSTEPPTSSPNSKKDPRMITFTIPAEDAARIAHVLRDYALEDFPDAATEALHGDDYLLRECAHIDYLADLIDPNAAHNQPAAN